MQCLCHTSVDSQEDKRVGVTKRDHEKESHPLLPTPPPPIQHPGGKKRKLGDGGRCCCSMAVGRCGGTGDKRGASSSKRRDACREGVEAGRPVREGLLSKDKEPPHRHWTCSFTPSSSFASSSLQQSTPDRQNSSIPPSLQRRSWCA